MFPIALTLVSTSYLYGLMSDPDMFDWFGSPYYEALYCTRDADEARTFINKIIPFLGLTPGARILDAPCGS